MLHQQHGGDADSAADHRRPRRGPVHDVGQDFAGRRREHDASGEMLNRADQCWPRPHVHRDRSSDDGGRCRDQGVDPGRDHHDLSYRVAALSTEFRADRNDATALRARRWHQRCPALAAKASAVRIDRFALRAGDATDRRRWIVPPVVAAGATVAAAIAMPVGTAMPPAMPAKNSIQNSHFQHSIFSFTDPPAA